MPKLKTHKGAAKRFKKTGTGKIKRRHAFARHILTSKSRSPKRRLGQSAIADPANSPEIKRMKFTLYVGRMELDSGTQRGFGEN